MLKSGSTRVALLMLAALALALFAPAAAAQAFPSKPLEFVVHTSPVGGGVPKDAR